MDRKSRQDSFEEKYIQGTSEQKEENKVLKKENRSEVVYGENVKILATMLYREGVMSNDRIADFLNAAGNGERNLSTGSVYQFSAKHLQATQNAVWNIWKKNCLTKE